MNYYPLLQRNRLATCSRPKKQGEQKKMVQKISRLPRSYKCSYYSFMYKAIYGDYDPIYNDPTDPPEVS